MAYVKPRISAVPIGLIPPKTAVATFRPRRTATPVVEEWRRHFPFGISIDASGATVDIKNMTSPATTQTVDPTNPTGFRTIINHPESGLLANHLNYIIWTAGSTIQDNVNALSTIVEAVPQNMWQVVAPYIQFDDEWFTNEGISHTDAEADALAAPVTSFYSTHPSVLAYVVADDVLTGTTKATRSISMSKALQRQDTFGRPASGMYIAGVTGPDFPDVKLLLWYYYPCGRYPNNTITTEGDLHRDSQGNISDYDPTATVASLPAGARTWMITQTHTTSGDDASTIRYPYPSEIRLITWITVGAGVKGMFWFTATDQPGDSLGLFNNDASRRAVLAVVSEMGGRLTPEIRQRLLTCDPVTAKFTASGGGNATYPSPYANATIFTLYDAAANVYYCVPVNRAATAAAVTISSATLSGTLVSMETGERFALGTAVTLPKFDGTIFWLDQTPGAPHVLFDSEDSVTELWDRHWMNPAAPQSRLRASIILHPREHPVDPGDLAAAIAAEPDGTTFRLKVGVHPRVEIIGRERLHFIADDVNNRPTVQGFSRVFGSQSAYQINGCCDQNDNGWVSDMFYYKEDQKTYDFRHPKKDFLFRDLDFSNTDGAISRQTLFTINFNSSPASVSDHWISNMPLFFRNVEDVLIEECAFAADYVMEDADGLLIGPPIYADVGMINGNAGVGYINVRNCTFAHPNPRKHPCKIFLDGSRGSCIYNADVVGGGSWHVADMMFFTNDDFTFDSDWDGTRDDERDARNAHHNIIANCVMGFSPEAFAVFQGHRNLLTDCTLTSAGGVTTAVLIDARQPNHGGVYRHVNNVVRNNAATGDITRFVTYQPDGGPTPPNAVGATTITGNSTTGTVGAWAADLPGSTVSSIGGDMISGNTP